VATKTGLYANINAKRKRIAAGSGEKMRKVGSKGAPTAMNFKEAAKTAKPVKKAKKWRALNITYLMAQSGQVLLTKCLVVYSQVKNIANHLKNLCTIKT